jgi:zinc protease
LGDAELMNTEFSKYQEVTVQDIQQYAQQIFDDNNCSTMHYYRNAPMD